MKRLATRSAWWQERPHTEVPAPSLRWAKKLCNEAFDLPFERFLEQQDEAMAIVLATEEHQAARRAWHARKTEKPRGGKP